MRALDLFCGAGGVSMRLHRAGFEISGVDILPQSHYPFDFIQGDALKAVLRGFDFIWASPPCQAHSRMCGCREGLANQYQDYIPAIRKRLRRWGGPWIIENVVGAPLENPIMLCGAMFGLKIYRHRIFESNLSLVVPPHSKHMVPASKAGHWREGTFISVAGHCSPINVARKAMGIYWMNQNELSEAIPPIYSEYLARQVITQL